jgi:multidrug efflux system membrane fusion protein
MRRFFLVAVCVVAVGATWLLFRSWTHGAVTPDKAKEAVPVQSAVVELRDVPISTTAIGTVQAYNSVLVRARVDGQLERVAFVEGQSVHAGDVLARIDPRPFEAQLKAAEAQKDKDAVQLGNAERDLHSTDFAQERIG